MTVDRVRVMIRRIGLLLVGLGCLAGPVAAQSSRFEVVLPTGTGEPLTGRLFVIATRDTMSEPRTQIGNEFQPPTFGMDVGPWQRGRPMVVDETALGFPVDGIRDLPAGMYSVQAFFNVYTEFRRADGRRIWAHMDQWEGQRMTRSPGNLYSEVRRVWLDPKQGFRITLSLTQTIPPLEPPRDTKWLKHVKIQSRLLTEFWGTPIYLGATVLLPRGYDEHPSVRYPVVYKQGHFGQIPFFFSDDPAHASDPRLESFNLQSGYHFYQSWIADDFPRMVAVTLHHPTPFYDDSYGVNSANNGPYGDAIMQELLPYLETRFRIIRKPYARLLEGASTGGWIALALQLYHPEFYGGAWVFYPDPIDFRRYMTIDIYADTNAFVYSNPRSEWLRHERPAARTPEGQMSETVRESSRMELVLGTKGRSGKQFHAWEAVFGPVGDDGYPKPLWNKLTGTIDRSVALYMREQGYDLRAYAERNWARIGPLLDGKIRIFTGDMDHYYLNLAVYRFEDFLRSTKDPHVPGYFEYGRPMQGHGWHPKSFAEILRDMAAWVKRNAPPEDDVSVWNY